MAFDDMPDMPRMLLRGAHEYADRILAASKQVAAAYPTVLDVPYGEDYWQKIDVYRPRDQTRRDLPVMCFIHGGAFRNGFKEWMGFMAPPLFRRPKGPKVSVLASSSSTCMVNSPIRICLSEASIPPAVFVSFSYRLAPGTRFPEIMHDCFDALKLVYDRAHDYGASRDRIFVGGHSAAGHLAALLALRRDQIEARGMPGDVIKGCLPVSGVFDLRRDHAAPGGVISRIHSELFDDPGIESEVSPLALTAGNETPFFVAWGGDDLEDVVSSSAALVTALRAESSTVEEYVWPRLGHFEVNEAQGNADDAWVQTARHWMQTSAPAH